MEIAHRLAILEVQAPKTYFWFSMKQTPADARAAPSASVPNDVDMGIASSPKRPRDLAQDNKVSQRATQFDPAMLESQFRTTKCLPRESLPNLPHPETITGSRSWSRITQIGQNESPIMKLYSYDLADHRFRFTGRVSYRPRSDARYVGSFPVSPSFLFPLSVSELRFVNQSNNQSFMSISSYASDSSAPSSPHSYEFSLSLSDP
eukprot:scaffold4160_cov130-Isochrysis_galbana.AAC.6